MIDFPWASAVVMVPVAGALLSGIIPGRWTAFTGMMASLFTVAAVGGLAAQVWQSGVIVEPLGGWEAPLGIELYVDGFSALMVSMTAVVGLFVSLYSTAYFQKSRHKPDSKEGHHSGFFWSLWLVVWAALNGVFLSSDLFNMYVCIEVMGLGSVALVAIAGPLALRAAMRYLLVTLAGSLLYLLGVALVYGGWGMLDVQALGDVVEATLASEVALGVMTLGLALKTALVPLHFWLPAAHANAPAPVSTVLSALVVKASFFILLRLWIDVFGAVDTAAASTFLSLLGTVAIVWGSLQALRQKRLKMLVAYSTVAQLGYLFVVFAPASNENGADVAWHGVAYFVIAHACSKGAMFLAAGAIAVALGHDTLSNMRGAGRRLAVPLFAFALAGIGLMGLPPSGGYTAKWLILTAAAQANQPLIAAVVNGGGLLAALYIFKVLYFTFARSSDGMEDTEVQKVPVRMATAALLLAVVSVGLGLWSAPVIEILDIGTPFGGELPQALQP